MCVCVCFFHITQVSYSHSRLKLCSKVEKVVEKSHNTMIECACQREREQCNCPRTAISVSGTFQFVLLQHSYQMLPQRWSIGQRSHGRKVIKSSSEMLFFGTAPSIGSWCIAPCNMARAVADVPLTANCKFGAKATLLIDPIPPSPWVVDAFRTVVA